MENIIKVQLAEGQNEIIVREGAALEPIKPAKAIAITGVLSAPFEFLSATRVYNADETHLQIFKDEGKLILKINDLSHESEQVITGTLSKDKTLQKFQINTPKRWTIKEFKEFIRQVAFYFADPAQVTALIASFNKFEATVTTVIKNHNANDGNILESVEKKVSELKLLTDFMLNIPIYQGYSKQKFKVEIGLDPTSTAVNLFLISDELYALEISLRESIVEKEVAKFDKMKFSKVNIS